MSGVLDSTLPNKTINYRFVRGKLSGSRFSQAVALMPALNGYGMLTVGDSSTSAVDTAAETFVTDGLSKVLKINNICDSEHLEDCGITTSYTTLTGIQNPMPSTMTELNSLMTYVSYSANGADPAGEHKMLDTKAAAFETQNGESILMFYNPNCVADMGDTYWYFAQPKICVNMIYDLNGTKGPNTVGKDIGFMTVLYPTDSVVVAPMPYRSVFSNVAQSEAASVCTARINGDYRIPTKDELASLFVNQNLISDSFENDHWYSSSKLVNSWGYTVNWLMVQSIGQYRFTGNGTSTTRGILCVQR